MTPQEQQEQDMRAACARAGQPFPPPLYHPPSASWPATRVILCQHIYDYPSLWAVCSVEMPSPPRLGEFIRPARRHTVGPVQRVVWDELHGRWLVSLASDEGDRPDRDPVIDRGITAPTAQVQYDYYRSRGWTVMGDEEYQAAYESQSVDPNQTE